MSIALIFLFISRQLSFTKRYVADIKCISNLKTLIKQLIDFIRTGQIFHSLARRPSGRRQAINFYAQDVILYINKRTN